MNGTAQPEEIRENLQATGTDGPVNLRDTVAERLAAKRRRRAQVSSHVRLEESELESTLRQRRDSARAAQRRGASAVRDTVRARYESSQSYREFLASEAERALAQAQAEADIAAHTARAVADAQMQLLEEMEQWKQTENSPRTQALDDAHAEARGDLAHALADIALGARELMAEPPLLTISEIPATAPVPSGSPRGSATVAEVSAGGLTVKLYEDFGPKLQGGHLASSRKNVGTSFTEGSEELQHLEQEIEYRHSPEFVDHVLETTPIPGNLIEFPRELIAPRRARPRLAEGPLREEAEAQQPQLRIFEVEAEQLDTTPAAADTHHHAPEWQSLLLEASREPETSAPRSAQAHYTLEPQTAPVELRLMAAAVDGCLVGAALLAFACAAAYVTGPGLRQMPLPSLLLSAFVTTAVLAFLYQMLFFTFADSTPGMRYARISLCTFGDRNPSRKAMRRRVLAALLAACPLGLGLLWMWMDDDRLGWHDRMSRMYQRAY